MGAAHGRATLGGTGSTWIGHSETGSTRVGYARVGYSSAAHGRAPLG